MITRSDEQQRDYWPTDAWRTAEPEAHGMQGALREFGEDPDSVLNGVVVVRHGYVVCEQYFRGFQADSYHTINSITKSVVSTLVGIALHRGWLDGLDEPLERWFPELKELDVDPRVHRIQLRNLLTMTAGWERQENDLAEFATNPALVAHILQRRMAREPGEAFGYDNLVAHLVAIVLARAAGMQLAELAAQTLLQPLGIWTERTPRFIWRSVAGVHHFHPAALWDEQSGLPWKVDAASRTTGYTGLHLTVRELAKFGYLCLNGGWWNGASLVPADFLAEATRPQSAGGVPGRAAYGLLWWVPAGDRNGTYFGLGFGGQYLWIVPQLDLVVAITSSGTQGGGHHGAMQTRDLLDQLVLPAVREQWSGCCKSDSGVHTIW